MPSSSPMSDVASIELPPWAQVSERRRAHIQRVTSLLQAWAEQMRVEPGEARAWRDAGCWHDALRDAPEQELRRLAPEARDFPAEVVHGPAAARRLEAEGESRAGVLSAIRWHTVGHPEWDRTGRA